MENQFAVTLAEVCNDVRFIRELNLGLLRGGAA
jgi:hypothetical protein